MVKWFSMTVGLVLLNCSVVLAQTKDGEAFFKVLSRVTHEKRAEMEPGEVRSALTGASASDGVRAFESATRLWASGRWLELEIAWLRQSDIQTRQFILALFYTQVADPDTTLFPPFAKYIRKFNPQEAKQRQTELDWVLKEKAVLKSRIDALLRK